MESRPIGVLFGFAFLTSAAYVLTTAIGIGLFLARVGLESLPLVLLASAIAVVVVSGVTYGLVNRIPPRRCVFAVWGGLALASAALSGAVLNAEDSAIVLGLVYVLAEVRGCLNTVYLTTLMTDTFRQTESKRPYTLVVAGAPVAGIMVGLVLTYGGIPIGNVRLLQLVTLLDLAVLGLAFFLPHRVALKDESQRIETPAVPSFSLPTFSRFRTHVTVMVIIKAAVLTLIGFQWKVSVSQYWNADESAMIVYFAIFYAISDGLILITQVFVAGRLLDRFGIGVALCGYPCLLAIVGCAAMFPRSPLAMMAMLTVARGMDVVRRSFHDPALASAFTIMSKQVRRQSIVIITGIAKPVSEVITALLLFTFMMPWSGFQITALWWVLILPWLLAAFAANRIHRSVRTNQALETNIVG